ncbi:cytochrome c biogenesis CcdA family protein [Aquabacter spiritensis]|uniref:Cytochrome c biogenesis transmembrane protein n=1 Tax=Aquabacter spiritensis TaxID=933073 RepID=A0A4R3M7S6_9HYPH|nr:cytochrome c biogenesis protein CcdA [Aquabacter spiritensis]TCT07677.1 cytochrome c biogenesis transmembrane protein [Aquabacter spiritensis]
MAPGDALLGFLAGLLSTLSPCVLPLLPLVLGAAVSQHRLGPVALAGGVALSFVVIGLFVATIGFAIGLDAGVFRLIAAALLSALGIVLLVPQFHARLATAAGPVAAWADRRFGGFSATGLAGQFALGLLLGAVWTPCVGPTLGAASVLAAQGRDLGAVAVIMLAFGLGAAAPLLLLGLVSRDVLLGSRDRLARAARGGRLVLGTLLLAVGLLILTGLDKRIEAGLVDLSPAWLTRLTTRF